MALLSWDPVRGLIVLRDELDGFAAAGPAGWSPAVDVYESANHYVLIAELPGVGADAVRITVRHNEVTLAGQRPERDVRPERYHRIERGHGQFSRTFSFPLPIDAQKVTAQYHDGVLTVTLPKAPPGEPRRVKVQ